MQQDWWCQHLATICQQKASFKPVPHFPQKNYIEFGSQSPFTYKIKRMKKTKVHEISCRFVPCLESRVRKRVLDRLSRGVRCKGACWLGGHGSGVSMLPWFSASDVTAALAISWLRMLFPANCGTLLRLLRTPLHNFWSGYLGMIDCSDPNARISKNSPETCLRFSEGKFFVSESRLQIFSIHSTWHLWMSRNSEHSKPSGNLLRAESTLKPTAGF